MYQWQYRSPFSTYYSHFNGGDTGLSKDFSKLKVYGEGRVRVQPDTAVVTLGVSTENMQLSMAQQENAARMRRVIDVLRSMGIDAKDIQTQSYVIEPQYDYIEGKQVFRGYRVINILSVKIKDLDKVGVIIDASVNAGANIVNNINFIVSNSSEYYKEALRLAIKDGQSKALVIGNELKVRLNPIPVKVVEQVNSDRVPPLPMVLKAAEAVTPIESGEIEIVARVEADFIYI